MLCLALQADSVKQLSQGVKASMAAFWIPERLHQLCRTLAYHFFTLTVIFAPATSHGLCPGWGSCAGTLVSAQHSNLGVGLSWGRQEGTWGSRFPSIFPSALSPQPSATPRPLISHHMDLSCLSCCSLRSFRQQLYRKHFLKCIAAQS